ncbi:unnamed protein product [Cladocopium goreaui]|uniref:Ubiquitin-like domain-containing protein n=1 Tax=Cladocopium goreaui TaxID=2562237 RepID=A0A9P1GTQ7_9DINO|nr:unnamed protein product [Cladocopium goreaui]
MFHEATQHGAAALCHAMAASRPMKNIQIQISWEVDAWARGECQAASFEAWLHGRSVQMKPLTVECHEGRIPTDTAEHSDRPPRLLLRLLQKGVAVAEVQLDPALTVQEVKEGLAEKLGTAPQDQRFFWRMRCLPASCLQDNRHNISLIPEISHRATGVPPICARRGMNMVPSGPSLPWKPSKFSKIRHEDLQLYFGDVAPLAPLELEDAPGPVKQGPAKVPKVQCQKERASLVNRPVVKPKSPWDGVTTENIFKRLHPVVQDMIYQTPSMKKEWEKTMNTAMLESKKKSIAEQQNLKDTLEDNLKQMNAIYDSNPNILQDFHSALQNGSGPRLRQSAFLEDSAKGTKTGGPWDDVTTENLFKRLHPVVRDMMEKMPGVKREWEKTINTALIQSKQKPVSEQQELRDAMEQNLKQMNAIYDANPRILEDVHRAVQGGSGSDFL